MHSLCPGLNLNVGEEQVEVCFPGVTCRPGNVGRLFHIPAPAVWRVHDQWLFSLDNTRVRPEIDGHGFPYEVQSTPSRFSGVQDAHTLGHSFKQSGEGCDCQFEDHACGMGPADRMVQRGSTRSATVVFDMRQIQFMSPTTRDMEISRKGCKAASKGARVRLSMITVQRAGLSSLKSLVEHIDLGVSWNC